MKKTVKITVSLNEGVDNSKIFDKINEVLDITAKNFETLHDALADLCKDTEIKVETNGDIHEGFKKVFKDSMGDNPDINVVFTQTEAQRTDDRKGDSLWRILAKAIIWSLAAALFYAIVKNV